MRAGWLFLAVLALFVAAPAVGVPASHYIPHMGDRFAYSELVSVANGTGNYSGYTDSTAINGSISVTAVASNGTASAQYYNLDRWADNQGDFQNTTSSGAFTFSSTTFLYVQGTDNQTGYVNPTVWFYVNNAMTAGTPFTLLNTAMTVVSTNYSYDLGTAAGQYVRTIFTWGNGSYIRDDDYGVFNAVYSWKAYFDPSTGYMVGYTYTETDTNNSPDAGSFTYTDHLAVTSTSYPLTAASGPSPGGGGSTSGSSFPTGLVIGLVVLVVVIIVILAVALALRGRRRGSLPTHSARGQVQYPTATPPPVGPAPPPVHLTPSGQPVVQQIVVKETVKVKCAYCGALIDSTAERCPFCGAART